MILIHKKCIMQVTKSHNFSIPSSLKRGSECSSGVEKVIVAPE